MRSVTEIQSIGSRKLKRRPQSQARVMQKEWRGDRNNYNSSQYNWYDPFHVHRGTNKITFHLFLKLMPSLLPTCLEKQEVPSVFLSPPSPPYVGVLLFVPITLCWTQNPGDPSGWRSHLGEFQEHFTDVGFVPKDKLCLGFCFGSVLQAHSYSLEGKETQLPSDLPSPWHEQSCPHPQHTHRLPPQTGLLPTSYF